MHFNMMYNIYISYLYKLFIKFIKYCLNSSNFSGLLCVINVRDSRRNVPVRKAAAQKCHGQMLKGEGKLRE